MTPELWHVYVCSYAKGRGGSLSFGQGIGDGWRHLLITRGRLWIRAVDPFNFATGKAKVSIWDHWEKKGQGDWSVFRDLDAKGLRRALRHTAKRMDRPVPAMVRELVR